MFNSPCYSPDKGGASGPAATSPGQAAFTSLCADFHFRRFPESVKQVLAEYMEALAGELAPHFGKTVSYQTLIETKVQALEFTVASGFLRKITNALTGANQGEAPAIVRFLDLSVSSVSEVIEELKDTCRDLSSKTAICGVTGEEIMLSEWVGLNRENRKKYKEGTLTIGEIFVLQPTMIIRNG